MRLPNVLSKKCSRTTFVVAVVAVLLVCAIHAAEQRTWTDNTGKFSVEAELVEVKDGQAVLKRSDGKTVSVPVNRLSKADQEYVQKQGEKLAAVWPVASATAPVDTTGLNLTLPDAMTEPPDWLANDPSVPFDLKAFFAVPPPEENAAPIYIWAISELEGPDSLRLHIHGIDRKQDPKKAEDLGAKQRSYYMSYASFRDRYWQFEKDPKADPEPPLSDAIDAFAPYSTGFALLLEAQKRPTCVFQHGREWHSDPVDFFLTNCHEIMRIMSSYALKNGDFKPALDQISFQLRLARDLRLRGNVSTQFHACRNERRAMVEIGKVLASPSVTVEHCDNLIAMLRHHQKERIDGYLDACCSSYITSRCLIRDLQSGKYKEDMQGIFRKGTPTTPIILLMSLVDYLSMSVMLPPEKLTQHPILGKGTFDNGRPSSEALAELGLKLETMNADDYAAEVSALNECYSALASLAGMTNLERMKRIDSVVDPLANRNIGVFLGPGMDATIRDAMRADTHLAGTECAIAMRRWQLEKGSPPTDLKSALQATGIAEIPLDPYSDKPLRTTTIDGKLVVYSIGSDGKDDGARVKAFHPKDKGGDPGGDVRKGDIVIDLQGVHM